MREISLFVEDFAHKEFLSALLQRLARHHGVDLRLDWRNVRRGHGAVVTELKQFLRDLQRGRGHLPDIVLIATDANCKGMTERRRELDSVSASTGIRTCFAIPDPHIERWLLLDSAAFKSVFGKGCDAPDRKCERDRYKKMLADAIRATGVTPSLGGLEFSEELVQAMDLDRVAASDASLNRLLAELRSIFTEFGSTPEA